MTASGRSQQTVGLVIVLLVGLAFASSLAVRAVAFQATPSPLQDIIEDVGGEFALEGHVEFGNVFYGEVLAVLREEHEKWGPEDIPNQIVYYSVLIEDTLRGEAKGEVDVKYAGADSMSPESLGFGPLKVGESYLFSAGTITEDGAYPVYAGIGTILVENKEAEEALLAEIRRLIPLTEAEERKALKEVTAVARERERED